MPTDPVPSIPFDLPVLGICGWSGSGKTTLIEAVLPHLIGKGLHVAVIKHDAHRPDVDRPGKDSFRLFRAGADLFLHSPHEALVRLHVSQSGAFGHALHTLSLQYDLILVEGHKDSPVPKVWLLGPGAEEPHLDRPGTLMVLGRECDRVGLLLSFLETWLPERWLETPVFGCILIGGKSRRMGTPKHLIVENGKTWLESTFEKVSRVCEKVVIAGEGSLPPRLGKSALRLPDVPGVEGPMAGILAAMRWAPGSSCLVAACDHPLLSRDALEWLLSTRRPGIWATVPETGHGPDPLLAHYDPRALSLLERLAACCDFSVRSILSHPKAISPSPPADLEAAWTNVNTLADRVPLGGRVD